MRLPSTVMPRRTSTAMPQLPGSAAVKRGEPDAVGGIGPLAVEEERVPAGPQTQG